MKTPQVAIVGRPNVGKSSIFNWLAGKRLAIVDDLAGVTRDRMMFLLEWEDRYFEIIDTGGIGITDSDDLNDQIEEQIAVGIDQADVIVFVVDTQTGILPLDVEVANRLRGSTKPVLLVSNKADGPSHDSGADEFLKLGHGDFLRVSTKANRNKSELLDLIVAHLPDVSLDGEGEEEPEMKVAIVGRRNVGKSTFVNSIVQSERMIVSEIPGTTRDSVDVRFEMDGKSFVAIDTPGLRRRVSIKTNVDFYGLRRAQRSIRHADVTLLFFDCSQRIGKVDKQLCSFISEEYKPCIFVVNKWDKMVGEMSTERWVEYLRDTFGNMWHVPIAFITGQTGRNVKTLLNHTQMLFKQSRERITTGQLNSLIKRAVEHNPPPMFKNKQPKIFYASQVGTEPPTIVLVCNQPKAFTPAYRRYLLGVFRDQLSFGEVPIKLYLQRRTQTDERDEVASRS